MCATYSTWACHPRNAILKDLWIDTQLGLPQEKVVRKRRPLELTQRSRSPVRQKERPARQKTPNEPRAHCLPPFHGAPRMHSSHFLVVQSSSPVFLVGLSSSPVDCRLINIMHTFVGFCRFQRHRVCLTWKRTKSAPDCFTLRLMIEHPTL